MKDKPTPKEKKLPVIKEPLSNKGIEFDGVWMNGKYEEDIIVFKSEDVKAAIEWSFKQVQEFRFPNNLYKGHISLFVVYEILRKAFEDVMKHE